MARTATKEKPATTDIEQASNNVPALSGPRLPYHPAIEERFGIDKASWKALVEAIFPNAQSVESVILALSYCRARKLDPFKRNVHIVPIWDSNRKCMVDTVWPGIGELRTTAFRTGEYAGREPTVFGPDITEKIGTMEITYPEWAQVTVYRMVKGQKVAFAGPRVYWIETYSTKRRDDDTPNEMWATRTRGQLDKCAEAASLRAAFPEEIGSDYIDAEIRSDRVVSTIDATESDPGAAGLARRLTAEQANSEPEAPTTTETPTVREVIDAIVVQKTGCPDAGLREIGIDRWAAASEIDAEVLNGPSDGNEAANAVVDAAEKCNLWATYLRD